MHWSVVVDAPDQVGESPFWHPLERMLYWVDIPARQLRRLAPGVGTVQSWDMPSEPGCIAPARSGGLVIGLRDGIYRALTWGGALRLVHQLDHDTTTTRVNDGKADPAGRFWVGTLYEPRNAALARLMSVDLRFAGEEAGSPTVCLQADGATTANGLAWSPDAATVYWADSPRHIIQAWDWNAASNQMCRPRVFHRFAGKPDGWQPGLSGYGGRPDGATVDSQGNYWCAMFEGQRLLKLSPAGAVVQELSVPMRCPTMPCFGGDDLRTLYLTSASHNRSAQELAEFPLSGRIVSTRVDVPGLPVNFVSD